MNTELSSLKSPNIQAVAEHMFNGLNVKGMYLSEVSLPTLYCTLDVVLSIELISGKVLVGICSLQLQIMSKILDEALSRLTS
jgi:hypothetical protein